MSKESLKIIEEPNVIDDHLLDIIGNEFNFDHEKGLAEWLKNSVDAYIREGTPDRKQHIVLRFTDGIKKSAVFECVDFVGMTETDIEKAFKRWGDPEAAKRGLKKRVYGGHGNGGKFYMRQMFEESHFITYKKGKISIFGFNKNKRYGFAKGFKSVQITPSKALEIAGIDNLVFPKGSKDLILNGKTGFTVVRGIGPAKMKKTIKLERLTDKLRNHPQIRRILDRINVSVTHNNFPDPFQIKSEEIKPLKGFEHPKVIEIPRKLSFTDGREVAETEMANKKYKPGKLILKTSEEAFGKGSRTGDLNRIDIIGEIGVIASYQLSLLGVTVFPQASFIYGECECPILEDPEMDAVKNDRSTLVETNPRSKALLRWLKEEVDEYANGIAAAERREQEIQQQKISVEYNDFLNKWKDRFMNKFIGDLFRRGSINPGEESDRSNKKRYLEVPENGLAFSFPEAQILMNQEEKITLKALVPDPIPLGGIIRLEISEPSIELPEKRIIVKAEGVKLSRTNERVAVFNVIVIGKKANATGTLTARAGKLSAQIKLETLDSLGMEKKKKSKNPQVLLSGIHSDPLNLAPGGILTLTDRDPLVYQRPQDVTENIYWINTQSPLAKAILQKYTDTSPRWRDYLFQRYVDIFTKQAIHELQKRDPEGFKADRIDNEILDSLTRKVHTAALNDLGKFFFEEAFEPLNETHEGN